MLAISPAAPAPPLYLAGGRSLAARPVEAQDEHCLLAFVSGLSERTRWLRYGQPTPQRLAHLAWSEAARLLSRDAARHTALAVFDDVNGQSEMVALGELISSGADPLVAEAALVVRDDHQRVGLGTALARMLMQAGRGRGVAVVRADIMAENTAMLALLRKLDLPYVTWTRRGEARVMAWLAPHSELQRGA